MRHHFNRQAALEEFGVVEVMHRGRLGRDERRVEGVVLGLRQVECSTKALLGGDADVISDIYRNRVLRRGKGSEVWGWGTAYGQPEAKPAPAAAPGAKS